MSDQPNPLDAETVRDAARTETEIASIEGDGAIGDHHGHRAFNNEERLVFVVMNVPRRLKPSRDHLIDQTERTVRLGGASADPSRQSKKPSALSRRGLDGLGFRLHVGHSKILRRRLGQGCIYRNHVWKLAVNG